MASEAEQRARDAKKAMAKRNAKKVAADPKQTAGIICGVATFLGFLLLWLNPQKGGASPVNDDALVDHVNRNAKTWKAAKAPMFDDWTIGDVRDLGSITWRDQEAQWHLCPPASEEAPASFDAREKWAACFQDRHIFETGNCSSSWATSAAAQVASRFCINEPDKYPGLTLSPQTLVSCDQNNDGCKGGGMDTVWSYIESDGLVSETCFPTKGGAPASCEDKCEDAPVKIQAKCAVQGVDAIKREIAANGPVVAQLLLSDELFLYKSGVFAQTPTAVHFPTKGRQGRQKKVSMVLLLGWGSDGDQEYWIVENSWGKQWGEDGYAKIAVPKADEMDRDQAVVVTDVVFVGVPSNHKFGQASPDYGDLDDLEFDDDMDDLDLGVDDDDLFADLDLDEAEE